MKPVTSYGNWSSAISSDLIVSDSITLDEPRQTRTGTYYIERRPQENGRCVIVATVDDISGDILPSPYSARSRVHEYGGGSYCIHEDTVFFVNDSDQDIYRVDNLQVSRITHLDNTRFADLIYDKKHHRLIAIAETHSDSKVTNSIVAIDIKKGVLTTLEQGCNFYASPRLNPDADRLCWQSWNHPDMPWDGNELWLAIIDTTGQTNNKKHIAGSDNISVFQPQWSPGGILHFISDDDGWWHLYRYSDTGEISPLTHGEKEFGLPQWVFAQSTYAFIDDANIVCYYQTKGQAKLSLLSSGNLTEISTPWQNFDSITACNDTVCFIAASSSCFPQLVSTTLPDLLKTYLNYNVIKDSSQLPVAEGYYSKTQNLSFFNRHRQKVFANYCPPTNPDYTHGKDTIENESAPPLIVICHGGPTGQSSVALDAKKQFWTSRGFALLDVNYSGSTGFGRKYRQRLNGKWGVLDVEDCCDAALHAVSLGLADKDQLIIRGSSAGGYTVLAALTFENIFSAGASYYGISELTSLASDTHKFESRYLDRLIGAFPEKKSLYEKRSPINSTDQLGCPVIFFQGIEDRVVPKEQAETMFAALEKKGLPVAAQYYEGEQHGFRKAETIIQSLENELSFYQLIFNLKERDSITFRGDLQIKNISDGTDTTSTTQK
ncbi:MAG TPA: S9 family peptidase [Gammaproteobacteria bacterium]|nr:S9 family peptidase [Gammaproteobacteria bacterium]